jgi:hypothetical protein
LISKKIFSENTLPNEPKVVGSIYGRSSMKLAQSIPIREQTWPPQVILVSDWLISKKIFSENTLPNEPKVVGSIYGRSSMTLAQSVPIREQTWPPQVILVSVG